MKGQKSITVILAAIMLFVIAAPSFAANMTGTESQQIPEYAGEAEGAEGDGSAEDITGEESPESGESDDEAIGMDDNDETGLPGGKPVLKKEEGTEVTYTAYKENLTAVATSIFSVNKDGTTYTGTCARQGISMKTSGTAKITRIPNSESIAKIVYHYAIELGDENWWDSPACSDRVGKIIGMSSVNSTRVTKRRMVECFCQMYNMGAAEWYKVITDTKTGGWGTGESSKIRDYYNSIDTSGIKVPDGFEIWYADAGDAQPFIIWAYDSAGYVTMKKISGNSSITG